MLKESILTDGTQRRKRIGNRHMNRPTSMPLHLMLIPGVIVVFIYCYLPMMGLVMAFQKFDIFLGLKAFTQSKWVGLQNYMDLIHMGDPVKVILNTVNISFWKIVVGYFVPVIMAILLNGISKSSVKRTFQTIIYMPHFISWVLLASVLKQILASDGVVNNLLGHIFNIEAIPFLTSNKWFVPSLVVTNVWKEFGFNTIIYLAAITSIDPTLYEAAIMDGANRWRQSINVTIPGMLPILVLTMVLTLQNVLNAGFDQIFNLYNVQVYDTGDIIDTWMYRMSFQASTPMYDKATAIGLFKSVVSLIFISASYWLAHRYANYRIF